MINLQRAKLLIQALDLLCMVRDTGPPVDLPTGEQIHILYGLVGDLEDYLSEQLGVVRTNKYNEHYDAIDNLLKEQILKDPLEYTARCTVCGGSGVGATPELAKEMVVCEGHLHESNLVDE